MRAGVRTDIGRVRATNEDSYIFEPPRLLMVADGMGGHVAGEVASNLATAAVKRYITENNGTMSPDRLLQQAIAEANKSIYAMSRQKDACNGMGTTATATFFTADKVYWGHVGDSRIYIYKKTGDLIQLTQDHSLVWELIRSGSLSKEEGKVHPQRNMLTRAVGTGPEIVVDCGFTVWQPGDSLLLCTDGLTNMVSEADIARLIGAGGDNLNLILDQLIEQANHTGGHDNITVIMARFEDD